ncbi:MAG: RNA-binding S4 domain-containing protein [Bacteroidaceae bacterium]|nr:RNA-binding S4 domain-containing protein [Bacteroidaceae bacterium]
MKEARADKLLWAVRLYKTRSLAAEACKKGRVKINGALAKSSKSIKNGDIIEVKKSPITYSYKILNVIEKRVGAKLIPEILEDITPKEQYELLEMTKISGFVDRERGMGRPTKRERRKIDNFTQFDSE